MRRLPGLIIPDRGMELASQIKVKVEAQSPAYGLYDLDDQVLFSLYEKL